MVKMEKFFFEVIVVGSGLSAKTTIVSLFKKGIIPFWIENIQNYKINDDRTTMLSPKSFKMFKELGLKDFEKKSFPTKKINIKTQNQKNFTVFEDKKSLPICYLTENNVLHQELDTLISKIEKNKKLVKVKDEIRSIKSDSDNNEIVLKSGDKIYSSLIIGVDGANSKIRKIQNIKTKKIKNFMGDYYKVPVYTNAKIFDEAKLFCDWYVVANKNKKDIKKINLQLKKIIKSLIKKIKLKNDTFVHRDFHISNIIPCKNSYGILDSQDAVIGNKAYDLASLIDDVRFQTSRKLKAKLFSYYIDINKNKINKIEFENDFYILSVLRNLKIIGIFTRLSIRDQKNQYLKLIPYAWKLIENRIKNKLIFKDLKLFLNKNFSAKLRKKNAN